MCFQDYCKSLKRKPATNQKQKLKGASNQKLAFYTPGVTNIFESNQWRCGCVVVVAGWFVLCYVVWVLVSVVVVFLVVDLVSVVTYIGTALYSMFFVVFFLCYCGFCNLFPVLICCSVCCCRLCRIWTSFAAGIPHILPVLFHTFFFPYTAYSVVRVPLLYSPYSTHSSALVSNFIQHIPLPFIPPILLSSFHAFCCPHSTHSTALIPHNPLP